ncbi:hypothetical protein T310_1950 [Rasamsonia emersonii CBS 393.64]|uniref:Rhomboid family membrane protein n=1 Tax=Rasamsonia emersonii (strain ATCC 16479 / CBS 393.64 / IMI 116815) TaxID=1408163 RepID=A0A0F4Z0J5_RASE3|nr:hypothetical protein T310_1950 [Rasamsonia emersonii CBS 393.64]KKA24029.1 hypothetical protein T310_1950 [Rasamsonia emersonii CBS 393.64]
MASTTDTTTPPSTDDIAARRYADYLRFKHYAAWTFVVASPVLIALPPRKLDLYTVALSSAFVVSANHLYRERYGRGILDGIGRRFAPDINTENITINTNNTSSSSSTTGGFLNDLPSARAQEIHNKLRAAREAKIREAEASGVVSEEIEKLKARQQQQERSLAERIWMGNETEGWKERRLREEQKALQEGKGYGDLILDHIWELHTYHITSHQSGNGTERNGTEQSSYIE